MGGLAKTLERAEISFRALTPNGGLERLVVARAILRHGLPRRATAGSLARLQLRIFESLRDRRQIQYGDWLRLYAPQDAPIAANEGQIASACAVLVPAGASVAALRRCLRALGQQACLPRKVIILCPTWLGRLKAALACRLEHRAVTVVRNTAGAGLRLQGDVLLMKGAPILRPRALARLTAELRAHPAAQAAYGDEDQLRDSRFRRPFFKPDFSPVLGRQYDYAGNVILLRRGFFERTVLPELTTAGLPSWIGDSALRRDAIIHLPEILHAEPSARRLSYVAGPAFDAALAAGCRRTPCLPRVAIIIPTKDRAELLRDCVASIFEMTAYDRAKLELVIVDNGSKAADACSLLAELQDRPAITVLRRPGRFNYSYLCNQGAAAAAADVLVFLNNDTLIRDPDWIAKLAGAVALPGTGVVGCKLLYADGLVQHAGVILGIQGLAGHVGVGAAEDDGVYFDLANHTREVSAVTGALVAIDSVLFERAGGYDERLAVAFSDTALCLACNHLGHQTLCLQSALAFHLEGASRGRDDADPAKRLRLLQECQQILSIWSGFKSDPFYNSNLSLLKPYELAHPPRNFLPAEGGDRAPHVLMLSWTFQFGSGIAVVVDILARALQAKGARVSIAAPANAGDLAWPAGERHDVSTVDAAVALAAKIGADVVMVHTPPFYAVFRYLPAHIAGIAYDHGEPPPELFPDAVERRLVNGDKYAAMRHADRVLAISDAVRDGSPFFDCGLLPLGNTHLARWNEGSPGLRLKARALRGWHGQLVILNVCRFFEAERYYKGIDFYMNLRRAVELLHPEVAALTRFVLTGRGASQDAAYASAGGIDVILSPSDDALAGLYHAADRYMNFSRWEGYNLGIGQALAMGLPVLASDIPAHRAFGIPVARSLQDAVEAVVQAFYHPQRSEGMEHRQPALQEWGPSAERLWVEIEQLRLRDPGSGPGFLAGATAAAGPIPLRAQAPLDAAGAP